MRTILDRWQPVERADSLLVLLPPAKASLEDLVAQGMIAAVRQRGLPLDIVLAEVGYQQVMAGTVAGSLHEAVMAPALEAGYRRIWLAGISLGAFNALHYAALYSRHLAGIKLLAPYPGTADILQEISAAGGPQTWADSPASLRQDERICWHWLCQQVASDDDDCPVWLGMAEQDRFVAGQQMLAGLLPSQRVHRVAGEHHWPVWQQLWQHWLDHGPLPAQLLPVKEQA
nr:alpha/beta hydrolase [uncultured Pseudogulbenkiania sp.]